MLRERAIISVADQARMQQRGVATAHIEHGDEHDPATALYIHEGFAHPRQVIKYMRRWRAATYGNGA